jgi:hypothetical protein
MTLAFHMSDNNMQIISSKPSRQTTNSQKYWTGTLYYYGISIKWDYKARTAELSMPGYIPNALHKYQHPAPTRPQHAPHTWNRPTYGATQQLADPADTTDPASELDQKRIQKVTDTLLFYARAVDPTMLMTLSTIAAQQSTATQNTIKATNQLLDYCHTHPNATIKYRASDMILKIHSNASYLAEPKACSRGGRTLLLRGQTVRHPRTTTRSPT